MVMASIEEILQDFESMESWQERYGYIIDLGKELPGLSEAQKTEANRVRGCVSNAWLVARRIEGKPPVYEFAADSDALMVRGLIAILLVLYSGKTAEGIQTVDLEGIMTRLGLRQHLSVSRQNGFMAMVNRIKALSI
jgi:cysteine desulfuration protein SufE